MMERMKAEVKEERKEKMLEVQREMRTGRMKEMQKAQWTEYTMEEK